MKRIKRISAFLTLSALVLASGCTGDRNELHPDTEKQDNAIILSAGNFTRSDGSAAYYPFRLYAVESGTTEWEGVLIAGTAASVKYSDGVIATRQSWPLNQARLRFVGAMVAGDAGDDETAAPCTEAAVDAYGMMRLTSGQGFGHDYLLSNNLIAGESDANKEMLFRHVMTKLTVRLEMSDKIALETRVTGSIEAGKLEGAYPALAEESDLASGEGEDVYLINYDVTARPAGSQDETPEMVYYLLADGSSITKMTDVTVNGTDGDDIVFKNPLNQPAGMELLPGMSYNLTLGISQRGVTGAVINIGPWETEQLDGSGGMDVDAKRLVVLWDAAGADVTAVELIGTDNTRFSSNVTKDAEKPGVGYATGATNISMAIDGVYGYNGDVRVEMTSPKADRAVLWEFIPAVPGSCDTLKLKRVLVATPVQLLAIDGGSSGGVAKHHYQVRDIDMSGYSTWYPIGYKYPFTGSYVGGGFKISNLKFSAADQKAGLFAATNGGALISGVHIASGSLTFAQGYSGAICGRNEGDSIIRDCINEANITASESIVGGIAALNWNGTVENCINRGSITINATAAKTTFGGVVGWNYVGMVRNSYNYGKIGGLANKIGGVVGINAANNTVAGCINYGEIAGKSTYTAGVVADSPGFVEDCTNKGIVGSTGNYTGGVVALSNANVTGCSNIGAVSSTGTYTGGVVGLGYANVTGCCNSGKITGTRYVGGVIARMHTSGYISGCTNSGRVESSYYKDTGTADELRSYMGGIVGMLSTTAAMPPITGCSNSGTVVSEAITVGGIAGYSSQNIESCENTGNVTARGLTGGIAGGIYGSTSAAPKTTKNCINRGTVKAFGDRYQAGTFLFEESSYTGGIVGLSYFMDVADCRNYGRIDATDGAGGISGVSYGDISGCHNYSHVSGRRQVGGIAGEVNFQTGFAFEVKSCENSGKVTYTDDRSQKTGGICGETQGATITDCRNTGEIEGYVAVGGICGQAGLPPSAYAKERTSHINGCTNYAKVTAAGVDLVTTPAWGASGGIAGYNIGLIENCVNEAAATVLCKDHYAGGITGYNQGRVVSSINKAGVKSEKNYAGGITGFQTTPTFDHSGLFDTNLGVYMCGNAGSVTSDGNYVGGVVGWGAAPTIACYNRGSVTGADYVGGVYGFLTNDGFRLRDPYEAYVTACYNTGSVTSTGTYAGGIAGSQWTLAVSVVAWEPHFTIQACYNTGVVSGAATMGGITSRVYGSNVMQKYTFIKNNYWDNNPSLPDVALRANKFDIADNLPMSAANWPSDDAAVNWGVAAAGNIAAWDTAWMTGPDAASGRFWKSLGSYGGEYPKLWWE